MPLNTNTANTDNISVGAPKVAGAIFRAPLTASLPTSALTELTGDFETLGYISEEGFTYTQSRNTTPVKDWSGQTIDDLQDEKGDAFKFKMLEILKPVVNKMIFGDSNVTGDIDTEMVIKSNAKELENHAYVVDFLLKGGAVRRIVIPKAKVTDISDVPYKKNELTGYEVTVTAYPCGDEEGNTHFQYVAKPSGATGATGATGTTGSDA